LQILYFGMWGAFSRRPLAKLLAAGASVCGVIVPGGDTAVPDPITRLHPKKQLSPLPLLTPYSAPNIVHLAWKYEIPTFELHHPRAPETRDTLAEHLGAESGSIVFTSGCTEADNIAIHSALSLCQPGRI